MPYELRDDLIDRGGRSSRPPSWSPLDVLAERELRGLRIEVIELPSAGHRPVAEIPDEQPACDVGFVDEAVVPVRRPVAAELDAGRIVRVDERGGIGEGDLLRGRGIREVDDADS